MPAPPSFFIEGNTQFFIRPLGWVGVWKVSSEVFWFMPDVVEDPVPHEKAQAFRQDENMFGWIRCHATVCPVATVPDSLLDGPVF